MSIGAYLSIALLSSLPSPSISSGAAPGEPQSAASAGASDAAPAEKAAEEPPTEPVAQPATKATASEAPKPTQPAQSTKANPAHLRTSAQLAELARRLSGHRASKQDIRWLEAAEKNPKKPEAYRVAAAILRAEQGFAHANIPDAIKRFEKLLKAHPELEDLLQLRLGEQALKVKQYDTAAKAFSAIDKRSWRGSRQRSARLGVLRAHYGAKRYKEARNAQRHYRRVCSRCMDGQTDEVLLMEAHLELLEGKRSKARALLTDLADRFPDRAGGAQADLLIQQHFPGEAQTLERKLRSIRYQAGRKGDRWAVDELRKLQTSYAKRPRLLLEVNIALGRQLRRVDPVEGVALLDRLLDAMEDNHPRRDALMAARRMVLPRVGRFTETADHYFEQAWTTQSSSFRMQRLFYTAWSLFGAGQYADAGSIFTWLITQKHVDRETKEKARWYAAWSLFRAQRYAEALSAFDRLASTRPRWAPKATYWAGRAAVAAGDVEKGMLRFQVLRDRWPHTLYGLRVASLPAVSPRAPYKLSEGRRKALAKGSTKTQLRLAVAANLGAAKWTRGEALRGRTPIDPELALQWGDALRSSGSHHAAFLIATRALRYVAGLPGERHRSLWELAYPRPWFARCGDCAEQENIPVAMVYSIMREESQFRPAVESPAEAVGLMQIIPPTAALIAARLEGRSVDPTALADPNHNIALGTWYLAGLAKRYDGQLPLVMAAYNAGPAAADGWIRRADALGMDLTQFMEEVPYKETRGYVKRVSRSLAVYRMLYGLEPGAFTPMVQGVVQNKISGDITF